MTKVLFTLFFACLTTFAWGQNEQQKKLEQRKAQIQQEIKEFRELLNRESKKEKSVLSQITEKNAKIKLSERLIATTQKQTRLLNDDMYRNQLQINKLNRELKVLKEDYAKTLVRSYKARSEQSRIMFILSSDNFLQAYKRMQYMKQYASFRKIQGDEIHTKMDELEALQQTLAGQKQEKQKLLTESEKEKQELEKERQEQEKLVKAIQKDKKKYAADIKKKQKESREIDRQIERMIKEAIAAANKKSAATRGTTKSTATTASKIELTREGKIVADNFRANKGRLPWPVERGYISQHSGRHVHPVYPDVVQDNKGVEITTDPGAKVRAVFGGEVMSIQKIAGMIGVYIQHGDYVTLYLNLNTVNVSTGEKISLKQNIGTVSVNPATGKSVLKFFIFQNTTNLTPEGWISQ